MTKAVALSFALCLAVVCPVRGVVADEAPNNALQVVDVASDGGVEKVPASIDDGAAERVPDFEPTQEWKEILPNQAIPGGLEVRIDLSTGKKEARMIRTDAPPPPPPNPALDELLARALPTGALEEEGATSMSPEQLTELRRKIWLKRQNELRVAMEARDEHTDVIARLVYVFMRPEGASEEEKISALHELEGLVDKLDFARDLHKLGGLLVTVAQLNDTLPLASAAAWVIGSAVKNDPVVQAEAVSLDAPRALTAMLGRAVDAGDGAAAKKARGRSHHRSQPRSAPPRPQALYASTSLMRGHATAQSAFHSAGFADVLTAALQDSAADTPVWQLVRARALAFLGDLLDARHGAGHHDEGLSTAPTDEGRVWPALLDALLGAEGCRAAAVAALPLREEQARELAVRAWARLAGQCGATLREQEDGAEALERTLQAWASEWEERARGVEAEAEGEEGLELLLGEDIHFEAALAATARSAAAILAGGV